MTDRGRTHRHRSPARKPPDRRPRAGARRVETAAITAILRRRSARRRDHQGRRCAGLLGRHRGRRPSRRLRVPSRPPPTPVRSLCAHAVVVVQAAVEAALRWSANAAPPGSALPATTADWIQITDGLTHRELVGLVADQAAQSRSFASSLLKAADLLGPSPGEPGSSGGRRGGDRRLRRPLRRPPLRGPVPGLPHV